MSKIINIPGTTSFIPLNDILDIKIHGILSEEERLVFPESPEDSFGIGVSSEVSLFIVTRYVTESANTDEASEDEDADESNDEDEGSTSETKTARILFKTHPLATGPVIELSESQQYASQEEKVQEQTELRTKLFTKNLAHIVARDEILMMSANTAPAELETIGGNTVAEVEEDDSVTTVQSSLLASSNYDPDQARLREITEYLEKDEDKQAKRIQYLEKHYNKSTIRVTQDDALEFLTTLRQGGLSEDNADILEQVIKTAIGEVAMLINT